MLLVGLVVCTTACSDRCVPGSSFQLVEAESGRVVWEIDGGYEFVLSVSQDGNTFASAIMAASAVSIRETGTGAVLRTIPFGTTSVTEGAVHVSSNLRWAVVLGGRGCSAWDLEAGTRVGVFDAGCQPAGITPAGVAVLQQLADEGIGFPSGFLWWEPMSDTQRPLSIVGVAWRMTLAPDGSQLLSVNGDGLFTLYDATTADRLLDFQTVPGARAVAYSADGAAVAIVDDEAGVSIWDLTTGTERRRIVPEGDQRQAATLSPSGKRLLTWAASAYLRDSVLRLWDVETGRLVRTFPDRGDGEWSPAFLPDERPFVTSWRCFGGI